MNNENPQIFDIKNFNDEMVISEKQDHYEVSLIDEHMIFWYSIDKITGSYSHLGHSELAREPVEEEELEEIY